MKYTLTLLASALLGLGALPSTADAATVVRVESSHYDHHHSDWHRSRHHRRHSRHVYHRAHWETRHGHRVYIPARTVVVYF